MLSGWKTKITGAVIALWGAIAPQLGVPEDITNSVLTILGGLAAIFMRDGVKSEAAKARGE